MGLCPPCSPILSSPGSQFGVIYHRAITTFWKMMLFQRIAKLQIFAISRLWSNKLSIAELWVNERRHSFALYAWIWWMMDILCLRLMVNKIMGTWKKKLAAFAAEAKAVALLLLLVLVLLLLRWWCDGKQRLSQTERLGFFNGQNKRIWQKPYFFRWEKNPSFVKLIPTFLACLLLRFENLFKSIKN